MTKRREAHATIRTGNLSLRVLAASRDDNIRRIVDRIAGETCDGGRYAVEFYMEAH